MFYLCWSPPHGPCELHSTCNGRSNHKPAYDNAISVFRIIFAGIGCVTRPKKLVLTQSPSPTPFTALKSTKSSPSVAICPECNREVAQPRKTWTMAGRPDKTGKRTELTIGLFDCPTCGKTFRTTLEKRKIEGSHHRSFFYRA